jgi:hypothetical protein
LKIHTSKSSGKTTALCVTMFTCPSAQEKTTISPQSPVMSWKGPLVNTLPANRITDADKGKNPAALALGKLGGKKRAAKLTAAQRSAIAKKGCC